MLLIQPERHHQLRQAARSLRYVPGVSILVRAVVRGVTQRSRLSLQNRQRLYNFFASDVASTTPVICSVSTPSGRQLRLRLNLQDDLSRMWFYLGYDNYESETVRLVCDLIRRNPGMCFLDVGANIGYFTFLAASALSELGQVHAFEPHPDVFDGLVASAGLNRFACLRLNHAAVADTEGTLPLYFEPSSPWTNASLVRGFMAQTSYLNVPALSLDHYCADHSLNRVDLVKIDAEGGDLPVLRGMSHIIDACSPDIICEVLEPYEESLEQFFNRLPYKRFLITRDGLKSVETIHAHPQFRNYYLTTAASLVSKH